MFKIITKADIILFVILVVLSIALSVAVAFGNTDGSQVVVSVAGEPYGTYRLDQDQEVTVKQKNHVNKFIIKDGKVQMTESDCRNKICIHDGAINKTRQTLVCLPNRVVIEIRGGGEEYDAISN